MPSPIAEAARLKQEALDKEKKEREANRGRVGYMKLKPGPNTVRILPPPPGQLEFWKEFKVTFIQVHKPKKANKVVVPGSQFGLEDPLQEEIERLYATKNPDDKAKADSYWARTRYNMFVIDRNDEENREPKIFDTNPTVFRDITAIFSDPDYDDITHPETGTDIVIHFKPDENDARRNSWSLIPKRNPSPLGSKEEIEKWTSEDLFEKNNIGKASDPDRVRKIIAGFDPDAEDSEEEKKKQDEAFHGKSSDSSGSYPNTGGHTIQPKDDLFWVDLPGAKEVIQYIGHEIIKLLDEGRTDLKVMALDQSGGWKDAGDFGLRPTHMSTPPKSPPSSPPKSSTPPKPSAPKPPEPEVDDEEAVEDEDEKELLEQLKALKRKKETPNGSSAAEDIRKALAKD